MAFPPAWVLLYEQAQHLAIDMTKEQAQELVQQMRVNGWEIVPGWLAAEVAKEAED